MKITNVTNKARWCHNKLIDAGESYETSKEEYLASARLSPKIFEITEKKTKVKQDGSI